MKPIPFFRLSIRQRLTFLICTLLLSVILIFGWLSYLGVRKEALKAGHERLHTLSEQLSAMLTNSTRNAIATTYALANRPAVKQYLLSAGKDSAAQVNTMLAELVSDTANLQLEIRDASNAKLLQFAREGIQININVDSLLLFPVDGRRDSGRAGKFFTLGDIIYYPIVSPVIGQGSILGYLVRWRQRTTNPRTLEQLSKIMGIDSRLYVGNADGTVWTDMRKVAAPPLRPADRGRVVEYYSSENNPVIATVYPIANSHWVLGLELSKKKIMETANGSLYWLMMAGSVLLLAGVFIAWLLSRNISKPLKNLTRAASAIAAGNYSSPVDMTRGDELGKLAAAFNAMCVQVRHSQAELEKKAENYKLLFENNPMPMWILSRETLDILDVNQAAIRHYGYTREEFLRLNTKDLRPLEDVAEYVSYVAQPNRRYSAGVWRHKKKNGDIIMVDIIADDIIYKGRNARLVLAHDVTEKLKVEAELVRNRIMQQELITETTILAQEKEREELGKELHDNVNQILASTKLYLEMARNGDEDVQSQAIEKSYDNVNLAIGEIRQLSKQLVPPSLDNTLVNAITDLVEEIKSAKAIGMALLTSKFNEKVVNENIKLMLYRIVQEQINNILKHALASEVIITLETSTEMAYLRIEDNGIGFDPRKKSKGIGLRNIDSRVKFHSGTANIISQAGKGCRLEVSVPLKKQTSVSVTQAV